MEIRTSRINTLHQLRDDPGNHNHCFAGHLNIVRLQIHVDGTLDMQHRRPVLPCPKDCFIYVHRSMNNASFGSFAFQHSMPFSNI